MFVWLTATKNIVASKRYGSKAPPPGQTGHRGVASTLQLERQIALERKVIRVDVLNNLHVPKETAK